VQNIGAKVTYYNVMFFIYMQKLYTYVEKSCTDAPKLVIDDLYIRIGGMFLVFDVN